MDNTIWDPLRKKYVAKTPEEKVRQWFISEILLNVMKIPSHMMGSEVKFNYGGKTFRADILVYDRDLKPILLVECKRPDVPINADVLRQAIDYNLSLNIDYLILTNGCKTILCRNKCGEIIQLDYFPTYEEMLRKEEFGI